MTFRCLEVKVGQVDVRTFHNCHEAIPRSPRLANPEKIDLSVFSDDSKEASALVGYLACQYADNAPSPRLIVSKCRVSLKAVTIFRLELVGAIVSSLLTQSVLKVLNVDRLVFCTDSENVWYWVRD